jgi:hypothetical protein
VVSGPWIYVLGGRNNNGDPVDKIWKGRRDPEEGVAPWSESGALPSSLYGHACAVYQGDHSDFVYVTGGWEGKTQVDGIHYARVGASGALSPWQEAAHRLSTAVNLHAAVVQQGRLYVLGGWDGYSAVSEVTSYRIRESGELEVGRQEFVAPLPQGGLYAHAAVGYTNQQGSWLYVIGGRNTDQVSQTGVFRARLDLDQSGLLGPWELIGHLPHPLHYHAAVIADNAIYVLGGHDGTNVRSEMYRAPIQLDGSLGQWTSMASWGPPRSPRYIHTALVGGNSLYVLGGYDENQQVQDSVFYSLSPLAFPLLLKPPQIAPTFTHTPTPLPTPTATHTPTVTPTNTEPAYPAPETATPRPTVMIVNYGYLDHPASIPDARVGEATTLVCGRAHVVGCTEGRGRCPGLRAYIGYGPIGGEPDAALTDLETEWTWTEAQFVGGYDTLWDTFQGTLAPQQPGRFRYCYRFTRDQEHWTYGGLESATAYGQLPSKYGHMTVR